jgi:gas vesicle structural protein
MAVERASAGSSLIDVLDRVLDKGIVIDAYVRVSLVGIDLVSVEARIVVASVETYLRYAEAIAVTGQASRPSLPGTPAAQQSDLERMRAENEELRRRLGEMS